MGVEIGMRVGRRVVTGFDRYGHAVLRCDCGGGGVVRPGRIRDPLIGYCQRRRCHERGDEAAALVVGSRVGALVATSDATPAGTGYLVRSWRCDCGRDVVLSEQRALRNRRCGSGGCLPVLKSAPVIVADDLTKARARRAVARAVKSGLLVRPRHCDLCGEQSQTQAHHRDYAHPLAVIWCCRECHEKEHHGVLPAPAQQPA